jgi:hypothetical protein
MGSVVVVYPDTWSFAEKYVSELVVPRELFGVSTSPLSMTPRGSEQPRPMIQDIDPSEVVIWSYYQAPGDPDPEHPDSVPDYSHWRPPLRYADSDVLEPTAAREWSSTDFSWRRLGFEVDETRITIWIWEGTSASSQALDEAAAIVRSVRVV